MSDSVSDTMWDSFVKLKHISQREVDLIDKYGTMMREELRDQINEGLVDKQYVQALVSVWHNFRFSATPKHIKLALLQAKNLLSLDPRRSLPLFVDPEGTLPYKDLLPMITKGPDSKESDPESQALACQILAYFCSVKDPQELGYTLGNCTRFINENIQQAVETSPTRGAAAVTACAVLMRSPHARQHYLKSQGPRMLAELLSNPNTPKQMLYETVLSLWLLTFSVESLDTFAEPETRVVANAVKYCLRHADDKVARVALALLRNLVGQYSSKGDNYNQIMVEQGVPEQLIDLKVRLWQPRDEPEVNDDIKALNKGIAADMRTRTSVDRFKAELASDRLTKGPLHTEKFWSENAYEFEWNEFEMIKQLVSLLDHNDVETVCLACYDLGEFTRYYEHGKAIMKTLRGKFKITQLLGHPNSDIQKAALKAAAKMLISNWRHI